MPSGKSGLLNFKQITASALQALPCKSVSRELCEIRSLAFTFSNFKLLVLRIISDKVQNVHPNITIGLNRIKVRAEYITSSEVSNPRGQTKGEIIHDMFSQNY